MDVSFPIGQGSDFEVEVKYNKKRGSVRKGK